MKARIAILLALGATACGCRGALCEATEERSAEPRSARHLPCLLEFTAIPLREATTGHPLVDVKLNGRVAPFLLDTGANVSVLHSRFAKEFGLQPSIPVGAAGIDGGAMEAAQARIGSLQIGTVSIDKRYIMVADLPLADLLGALDKTTVYGIVGQDVLKAHRAIIDVGGRTLYLITDHSRPLRVSEECEE